MKTGFLWGIVTYLLSLLAGVSILFYLSQDLPSPDEITAYKPPLTTEVYDRNNKLLYQFYLEKRTPISLLKVPRYLVDAFISLEDRNFWSHWGINLKAIMRAGFVNLLNRRIVQGGSTITQQLARNMFLSQERNIKRKLQEMILSVLIERRFSKDEILEKYLNQIYFGHGIYGVESASEFYFGKSVEAITLPEAALIAGIPRSPLMFSPYRNPQRAQNRQKLVLRVMLNNGVIDHKEYESALKTEISLKGASEGTFAGTVAPYLMEMIRRYVEERYGGEFLYQEGGKIYTTLDRDIQKVAESVLDSVLSVYEEVFHFSPTKSEYSPDEDSLPPKYIQGALVSLDVHTGEILALVGGRDYKESQFNRVIQAKRQPGSAFKLFVYTSAIDNGYSPSDIILDAPVLIPQVGDNEDWYPLNYDERYLGRIPIRKGIALSRNLATVRLALEIGPSVIAEYAKRMGITSPIPPYPSIALGSPSVSLLELTRGYATIANYGKRTNPFYIKKIVDRDGNVLEMNLPVSEQVLDSTTSYIMIDLLSSVIKEGTARRALIQFGLNTPSAGKTGTTNEYRDTWFVGFTPSIVAGVWVGFDSLRTIMDNATGAGLALPIWTIFIKKVTGNTSREDFPVPSGIDWAKVCTSSGLLAGPYCPDVRIEIFKENNIPKEACKIHTGGEENQIEEEFDRLEREFLMNE